MSAETPSFFKKHKELLFWGISILLSLLVLALPQAEGFTPQIRTFFVLTIFAIAMWAFELMPFMIPGILLSVLYIIFGLAKPPQAFFAWSVPIPWLLCAGMVLTGIVADTGLIKRISYRCILNVGGSYRGVLYGLMLAGVIFAIFIPDIGSRLIGCTALSVGLCRSLNLEPKSKASSGIMLAAAVSALTPGFVFYPSASMTLIIYGIAERFGISTTWLEYFQYNGFIAIIFCVISIVLVDVMFTGKRQKSGRGVIKSKISEEYRALGRVTLNEIKACVVLTALLAVMLTEKWHHINIGWVFVIFTTICYLPGINLGDQSHVKKVNYPLIIFVVSCMNIGFVSNTTGAGAYVAKLLQGALSGSNSYMVCSSWTLAVIINFIMTPLAAVSTLTEPLLRLVQEAGYNPVPILFSWTQGLEQIIFPYQYALILYVYGFGYLKMRDLIQYFALRMLASGIFIVVICIPFWKLIGTVQ